MDLQKSLDATVAVYQRAAQLETLVARVCERVVKSPTARECLGQELPELRRLRPDLFPKPEKPDGT